MQLQTIDLKSFAILFAIVATGPIVAGVVLARQAGTANQPAFWGILAVAVLTLAVIGGSMQNRSVAIRDDELVVKSTFYSTSIPLISISSISTVAPGSPSDLVGMRVNGVGLPGFRSGWFNSKAGGRLFVDRVAGDYLLIFADGKPRLALQFSDNQSAAQILSAAIPKAAK
jgi:hypothetical protein